MTLTGLRIFLYSRAFLPAVGGVEQPSLLLARGLVRRGRRVTVATDVAASDDANRDAGFEVLRRPSFPTLVRAARSADLVHSSGFSMVAFPLAAGARRPLVFTHHGYQASCLVGLGWHDGTRCGRRIGACLFLTLKQHGFTYAARQLARHLIARRVLGRAAAHVCVSSFLADAIRVPRCTVIPNCVDGSVFRPSASTGGRRFLFVGRFVREKGVDVLLRAVATCERDGMPIELDLVGSGPLESEYRALAKELAIEKRVAFRGPLRGDALASAKSAGVLPSFSRRLWTKPLGSPLLRPCLAAALPSSRMSGACRRPSHRANAPFRRGTSKPGRKYCGAFSRMRNGAVG